jgi:hypothetical protein
MSTSTYAVRSGFCETCYLEGIERQCRGYAFTTWDGRATYAVPPLPRAQAVLVRRAAREYLAQNGPGDAARHPGHADA